MPLIPDYRQPQRSDIPELTDPMVKALDPVSDQLDRLTKACQGKLSDDNLQYEKRDLTIKSGHPVIVGLKKKNLGRPNGMDIVHSIPAYFRQGYMEILDQETVQLTIWLSTTPQFTVTAGLTALVRVRIWGN